MKNNNIDSKRTNNVQGTSNHVIKKMLLLVFVFAGLFVAGVAVGATVGEMQKNKRVSEEIWNIARQIGQATPVIYLIFAVIFLITIMVLYCLCVKKFQKLQDDMDDEQIWNQLELIMNRPMILINLLTVVNLFFFGVMIVYFLDMKNPICIVDALLFVVVTIFNFVITGKLVNIEKTLNQHHKVRVLDLRFAQSWFETADEAERQMMYRAGYSAYKAMNIICAVMWIVTFMGMLAFRTGIFAYVCVSLIWLVNVMTYTLSGVKQQKIK